MHHLPRFVTRGKKSGKKAKGGGPKLERLNAMRYSDYEPPVDLRGGGATTSSSSLESGMYRYGIRSAGFVEGRMSFRIEGAEGEIAKMCRSMGLSGPDDFDISTEAWEALKGRTYGELISSNSKLNLSGNENPNSDELGEREVVKEEEDTVSELAGRAEDSVRICEEVAKTSGEGHEEEEVYAFGGRKRGIKGARPPVLIPPVGMTYPMMDGGGGGWDMHMSYVSGLHRGGSLISQAGLSSFRADGCEEEKEVGEREEVGGAGNGLPDSCIFSTSNDGDDSSTATSDATPNVSPVDRLKPIISGWLKGKLLGRGSYGSVYEGFSVDGTFFAIKEVSLVDEGIQAQQSVSQLEQEIALLRQFKHENIVQYYGTDKDDTNLYIFLELVTQGSLLSLYRTYKLQDSQVSVYTRQILHGLKYLHDRNVVHRDIKCANILVDASGSVKLADFGLAKATRKNDVKSCKGTPYWMAPEVVHGKKQGYGLAADIWSLGCTVLEMLTQQIPYYHLEWMPAFYNIGQGILPEIPDYLSNDSRNFILQCLKVNPQDRPTAKELLDHPFVKRSVQIPIGFPSPFHYRRL